jgi:hypothetical protein
MNVPLNGAKCIWCGEPANHMTIRQVPEGTIREVHHLDGSAVCRWTINKITPEVAREIAEDVRIERMLDAAS